MDTFRIVGCNRNNIFITVPLIFNLYSDHEIGLFRRFIIVHKVHITTASKLNIKGSTEIPIRLAYIGLTLFLSTIQSRFNAISVPDPNFSYVS